MPGKHRKLFHVEEYDLSGTLESGQAFRWTFEQGAWTSVIGSRWVRLRQERQGILAECAEPVAGWQWLTNYLQLDVNVRDILSVLPDDEPLRQARAACRGLRLLRQDPWECLASFILSSTKQIVQIRQVIGYLCESYGTPVKVPAGELPRNSFPSPQRIAALSETDLRRCRMGFRAPYLLKTAREIASGRFDPPSLRNRELREAREQLLSLPGVGRKIADCVLLFAYGFGAAFPLDVWMIKVLRKYYLPGGSAGRNELLAFAENYFGPHGGFAQQYLFHYMRTRMPRT